MKTIKDWLAVFILMGLILMASGAAWVLAGPREAMTLCAGGGISLLTLAGVVWMTKRVIDKKPIALTASSIVIKYALLGGILYVLTQRLELDVLWLGLGVSLILPSLIIFGFTSEKGLSEAYSDEVDDEDE
tara:strand:- start:3009 stop:3401 length:393 start_codon:yes stop_codon:yes gene_type:complete